jgi:starvation-inducible DNA-binding protein
MSGTFVRSIL